MGAANTSEHFFINFLKVISFLLSSQNTVKDLFFDQLSEEIFKLYASPAFLLMRSIDFLMPGGDADEG